MIIVHSLSKTFLDKLVLDSISLTIRAGDRVGLVGDNGSGKSTLLRILARVEKADSGTVEIKGTIDYLPQVRTKSARSSGEQTWDQLQVILLESPDFLLLDEPTNHLDLKSQLRLEKQLKSFSGAVIIVSHDRAFLEEVTNKTFYLDNGKLSVYGGNYSFFKAQREIAKEANKRNYLVQEKRNKKVEKRVSEVKQGVQLLEQQTSGTDHYVRRKAAKGAKSALAMIKRLEIEKQKSEIPKPELEFNLALLFAPKTQSSQTVVFSKEISIERSERVALTGANGSGKTTLIKKIVSKELEIGNNVDIGYLPQEIESVMESKETLLDYLLNNTDLSRTNAYKIAYTFLFSEEDLTTPVFLLSSGQQSRLRLAELMAKKANFLVLDEPTNHLDIKAREALERALAAYKGTLLIASHDRVFLEQIRIDRSLAMKS